MKAESTFLFLAGYIVAWFFATLFTIGHWPDILGKATGLWKKGKGGGLAGTLATYLYILWVASLANAANVMFWSFLVCTVFGWLAFHYGAKLICMLADGPVIKHDGSVTEHDPNQIVIDEAAGFLGLAYIIYRFLPVDHATRLWLLFIGFIWFRLWDTKKPFFVAWVEKKFPNAFGGMADDVIIGLAIGAIFWAVHYLAPSYLLTITSSLLTFEFMRIIGISHKKKIEKAKLSINK